MRRIVSWIAAAVLVAPCLAQTRPAYDVVSIKPNTSGHSGYDVDVAGSLYQAANISLKTLLSDAYGIRADLISGLPAWAGAARFDMQAKVIDSDPRVLSKMKAKERGALLQPVLMERFHVRLHRETKLLPILKLVVARGGVKFSEAATGEPAWHDVSLNGTSVHNGHLVAHAVSLEGLAEMIAGQMHRTVEDKTGLSGKYDLILNWSPEGTVPAIDPELATALVEQLGLKLQATRGPVDTLVIDHAEMPGED
jgi:uncharacterized protein (TIGR03435 family)